MRRLFDIRDKVEAACEEVVQREGISVGCPGTEDEILQDGGTRANFRSLALQCHYAIATFYVKLSHYLI